MNIRVAIPGTWDEQEVAKMSTEELGKIRATVNESVGRYANALIWLQRKTTPESDRAAKVVQHLLTSIAQQQALLHHEVTLRRREWELIKIGL